MPQPSQPLSFRELIQMAEDARLGLEAFDAAGAGIAGALRARTLDPDGAYQMLQLMNEGMKGRLDALVSALYAASLGDNYLRLPTRSGTTGAPSRSWTR